MKTIERIRRNVEQWPDRIAYSFRKDRLSYRELWEKSTAFARALQRRQVNTCVLFGGKEKQMPAAMLGSLLAGTTYVPVTESTPPLRLQQILEACRADCVISSRAPVLSSIPWLGAETLCAEGEAISSLQTADDKPAYIIFTSGSTGVPKGVPISRENLDNFTDWILSIPELAAQRNANVLNQASFSFDLSVADLYYALCGGHELHALDPALSMDPAGLHNFWKDAEINVAVVTPTFLKLCLTDPSFCAEEVPALNVVYSCGERLDPGLASKLLKRFPKLTLLNAYGPTEATSAICAIKITKEMTAQQRLPVGTLREAACEIRIENGEIVLKGKSVFSGYLGNSTGGHFLEDGVNCFRTGDIGEVSGNLLYCDGRKDRQIKWKGYRIELDEIERQLAALPGVKSCAVIAKRSSKGDIRCVKAFVVPEKECQDTEKAGREGELRSLLSRSLPEYMIPKSFEFISTLPVNSNGKLDRKELEKM